MDRSTWKKGESRISARFGTHRTPLSGGNSRHTTSDTLHSKLYLEIKHRKKMPFSSLWKEVRKEALKEKKIPVIILLEKGSPFPMIFAPLDDIPAIAKELIISENRELANLSNASLDEGEAHAPLVSSSTSGGKDSPEVSAVPKR